MNNHGRTRLRALVVTVLLAISTALNATVYLVAAGVNNYENFPGGGANNLTLSVKDVNAITKLYTHNTTVKYMALTDDKATRSGIKQAIHNIFGQADPDDIVVFYFSGHGFKGGFCAYDGTLSYAEVRKAMAPSRCKNKMMFIDACHAGGLRSKKQSGGSSNSSSKKANVMLFLSSRDNEVSRENPFLNNGLFTAHLINGLKGGADENKDRIITAKELFTYVQKKVLAGSGNTQHPVMWGRFENSMPVMKW